MENIKPVKPEVQRMKIEDVDNKTARKMIAQDILDGLNAKFLFAHTGVYIDVPERMDDYHVQRFIQAEGSTLYGKNPFYDGDMFPPSTSAQEAVESFPVCSVCAVGATLVSALRRFNACHVGDLGQLCGDSRSGSMEYLQKFFSARELALMEGCFEGRLYCSWMPEEEQISLLKEKYNYMEFYCRYTNSESRLRAIAQNILDNDGQFIPDLKKVEPIVDEDEDEDDDEDSDEGSNFCCSDSGTEFCVCESEDE